MYDVVVLLAYISRMIFLIMLAMTGFVCYQAGLRKGAVKDPPVIRIRCKDGLAFHIQHSAEEDAYEDCYEHGGIIGIKATKE